MARSSFRGEFGINVVGHVKGEFGLGESARAQIRSIKAANIPYVISNIDSRDHRSLDSSFQTQEFTDENPYIINLLNFNAEAMPEFLDLRGSTYLEGKYNIGYWAWELPIFPREWEWIFQFYDEIWVPSSYCAESLSSISPVPVVKIMHSIDLPPPSLDREAIGYPKDKFIFLFVFDFHSTLARKNPIAVIEAFKQAFERSNPDVLLVIKFSNGHRYPDQVELVKNVAAGYPIQFIEGHLRKDEVNALFYNCDCYVSLHRSEGFGLTMAESMYYGKPVIATNYSANVEFMNVGNSFLVKYDMVDIEENVGSYQKGNTWADPDIEQTACLMHYVFHNYEQALQVGARASRDVRAKLSPQAIGRRLRERVENIVSRVSLNSQNSERIMNAKLSAWRKTAQQLQMELNALRSTSQPNRGNESILVTHQSNYESTRYE
jgi:glycosyltransferase involved in cell wall biosynthesis